MPTTPSKKLKPFMAYIEEKQYARMRKFANLKHIPMSQLIREAIEMRIAAGDPYTSGFNAGLDKAVTVVSNNKASQMRFPSGKSFAELFTDEIHSVRLSVNNEEVLP